MKKIVVLTLFENMFEAFCNTSIIKRAIEKEIVQIEIVDIRKFSTDKHRRVDFPPYGGGSGMIISCEPLAGAIDYSKELLLKDCSNASIDIIYMSPRGKTLKQNVCKDFATKEANYIIICGHYEGIDQRIIDEYDIEEISIGDFVLTGGEIPAQVFMDSIIRLLPGVIKEESLKEESHTNNMLEYPQYTKPYEFRGRQVPEVLISGHHKKIEEFNQSESYRITKINRPDLTN